MTRIIALLLTLCAAITAAAQTVVPPSSVQNLYMLGGSYAPGAQPSGAGTALYAHQINQSGTFAFTLIDALPLTYKPFTVSTNIGVGIAQNIATIGKLSIFVPTAVGIQWTGTNTGWQWSTGAGIPIKIKNSSWYIMPIARVLKGSATGQTGFEPVGGILVGWGK